MTQKINLNKNIINKLFGESKKEDFELSENVDFNYFALINDCDLDLHIETSGNNIRGNIFVVCFGKGKISANTVVEINGSDCDFNVNVLSLLQNDNDINASGDIVLKKNISHSQGHLLEKNIVLGKKIKVKMTPKLDVYSRDVYATHGVSIDRIDPEKNFYIQSRGLSSIESLKLILSGYINYILEPFKDITEDDKKDILGIILSNIHTDD